MSPDELAETADDIEAAIIHESLRRSRWFVGHYPSRGGYTVILSRPPRLVRVEAPTKLQAYQVAIRWVGRTPGGP